MVGVGLGGFIGFNRQQVVHAAVAYWPDVLRSCGLNARLVQNTEAST